MKDAHDNQTPDLLPIKRPRGRPRTGKAMTQAERQAKYRAKVAQNNVTVTINRGILERLDAQMRRYGMGIAPRSSRQTRRGRFWRLYAVHRWCSSKDRAGRPCKRP